MTNDLITRIESADGPDWDGLKNSLADAERRFSELPIAIRSRTPRPALKARGV